MSFWEDFKKFAVRGNAIDLAVGVVVGGAFGKIVTSLVNDIVLPPIGLLLGKVDFTTCSWSWGRVPTPRWRRQRRRGCRSWAMERS